MVAEGQFNGEEVAVVRFSLDKARPLAQDSSFVEWCSLLVESVMEHLMFPRLTG